MPRGSQSAAYPDIRGRSTWAAKRAEGVLCALDMRVSYIILVTMSSSAWPGKGCASAIERRDVATVGRVLDLTHLHVLKAVLLADAAEHVLLAALLHFACQQKLVEDEVGLLEVEDDVKLAHVAVVLVHLLDIAMDNLESDQLVIGGVTAGDEEERCIAAVYNLGVCGTM
jgi:hypothetical protein